MSWLLGHPRGQELSRFVDDTLGSGERAEIRAHLAGCQRCRNEVAFLRELGKTARQVRSPLPPAGLLDNILARREAGERRVLPADSPEEDYARVSPRLLAALIIALLTAGGAFAFLLRAPEAGASSSMLEFLSDRPFVGTEIRVAYRPAFPLTDHESLVLRARYRRALDRAANESIETTHLAVLTRAGPARYEGAVALPADAVYATFAVEDAAGELLDTNGGASWELLAEDAAGRPVLPALRQQVLEWTGRSRGRALQSARRMVEVYPDEPEAWYRLLDIQRHTAGRAGADSLHADHLARFRDLEIMVAREASPSPDRLFALSYYAELLGERDAAYRWVTRLIEAHPNHPKAVQRVVALRFREHREQPAPLLAALDSIWQRVGPAQDLLVQVGIQAARTLGDSEAIARWARRYVHMRPWEALLVAQRLPPEPGLRPLAEELVRASIRRHLSASESRRPLARSTAEQRALDEEMLAEAHAELARILAAQGRAAAAREALEHVERSSWNVAAYAQAAALHLAFGDTAQALELYARAAADPEPPASVLDTLAKYGPIHSPVFSLDEALARARVLMTRATLEHAIKRPLPSAIALEDAFSHRVELGALTRGNVTFVAFWSRAALEAAGEGELLRRRERLLAERGVGIVNIVRSGAPFEAGDIGSGWPSDLPVFLDVTEAAAQAFNRWSLPAYYLLDEQGSLRFANTRLSDVLRQVEALRHEKSLLAVPQAP